jgi:hypothetical protein
VLFHAPVDLILSDTTVLQTDLLVVVRGRENMISQRASTGHQIS